MSYQVLARKYRPRRFADMVGQEPVVRTLANALSSGRVHHAYVFSGIRGIGKTTSARLLARALNCASGPTADPCGTCPACVEIGEGRSIDAVEIDAASNRGIEEIKALIQSAQYSPSRDRHKVYIVDEFHMLTREAFNALLKTLEEPPPHVVFILATTELEKVPATILSRCLLLPFRPVSAAQLRDHLLEVAGKEGVTLDPAAADLIARKAGGSIRDAQSTLDRVIALAGDSVDRDATARVLGLTDGVVLRATLGAVLEGRSADALKIVDDVASAGADLQAFLEELLAEARAALVVKVVDAKAAAGMLGQPAEAIAELEAIAALGSEDDLRRVVDRLIDAGPRLRLAGEPRFVLEALVVRLAQLVRLEPLAEIARRIGSGGGGQADAAPSQAPLAAPVAKAAPRQAAPPAPEPSRTIKSSAPGPAAKSGWRDRIGSVGEEQAAEGEQGPRASAAPQDTPARDADVAPARNAEPAPARVAEADPLERFRGGLPPRLRGHVEHGLIRRHEDGLAIVLPTDRAAVRENAEDARFHFVAAAAHAFGRPVPVTVTLDEELLGRASEPGEIEGSDLAARRLLGRAERSSLVQAVTSRFDGRITSVVPPTTGR